MYPYPGSVTKVWPELPVRFGPPPSFREDELLFDVYICPNVHRKETSLPFLNARGVGDKFKMAQKITRGAPFWPSDNIGITVVAKPVWTGSFSDRVNENLPTNSQRKTCISSNLPPQCGNRDKPGDCYSRKTPSAMWKSGMDAVAVLRLGRGRKRGAVRLATANPSMVPFTEVETPFRPITAHVHLIKLFSTMVETLSEAKARRGDLIPPPPPRQFAIDDRLFADRPASVRKRYGRRPYFDGRARLRDGVHPYIPIVYRPIQPASGIELVRMFAQRDSCLTNERCVWEFNRCDGTDLTCDTT
ncbi:hypothetical protein B0H13DRAFT_1899105 [Mycena leptocephala]|nr:hypothetical protein B0H13DRAFT_1899105 [Mycena leptocephala]